MNKSNDNLYSQNSILNRQSSRDKLSLEMFELPFKRPKVSILKKLDNPSTGKLQYEQSPNFDQYQTRDQTHVTFKETSKIRKKMTQIQKDEIIYNLRDTNKI